MSTRSDRRVFEKSLNRHRRVQQLNSSILEFLDRSRPDVRDPDAHRWASSLYRRLCKLHEHVSLACRVGATNGVMERLAETHPRAARDLLRLGRRHDRILCDLRALVGASMTYAEAKLPPNPRLRSWTRGVLTDLSRHELAETTLIQELVTTDIGTGD